MPYHYSTPTIAPHSKAVGRSLVISMKEAVVVSHELRGKKLSDAKAILKRVISMEKPMPYFRYYHNVGHRAGSMGPGRYPISTSKAILSVLESAESNATLQGMALDKLVVSSILANKGSINWRGGRRRVRGKRTHVEVILKTFEEQPPVKHKPFSKKEKTASSAHSPTPLKILEATP